jgi:hypothetical protein
MRHGGAVTPRPSLEPGKVAFCGSLKLFLQPQVDDYLTEKPAE